MKTLHLFFISFFLAPYSIAGDGFGDPITVLGSTNNTRTDNESLAVGDINRDGIVDIVYTASAADRIYWMAGNGDGTFAASIEVGEVDFAPSIKLFDFDRDGDLDVFANFADGSDRGIWMFRNQGSGTFSTPIAVGGTSFSPVNFGFARMDGDAWPDLVWLQDGAVVWYRNNAGNGTIGFDNQITGYFSDYSPRNPDFRAMVLDDLNGNNRVDLCLAAGHTVFSNPIQEGAGLYIHPGSTSGIAAAPTPLVEYTWEQFGVQEYASPDYLISVDLNKDGYKDLIYPRNDANSQTLLIFRNGGGLFQTQTVTSHFDSWFRCEHAATADFDLDGDIDLAGALYEDSSTDQIRMLWNDGTANAGMALGQETAYFMNGDIGSMIPGDFTGDGLTDLLFAHRPSSGNNGITQIILLPRSEADLQEDAYEENDSIASAYSPPQGRYLSRVAGFGRAFENDSDWYQVSVKLASVPLDLNLRFTHNPGDLRLVLYDAQGNEIDRSDTSTHNESLSNLLAPGTYFVEIAGGTADGVAYDFGWFHDADRSPPRVTYKKPRNKSEMKGRATHFGTAADDCGVAQVVYKWTGAKWKQARLSGSGKWSFKMSRNHPNYRRKRSVTVLVYAIDSAGKRSKTIRRKFRRS